MKRKYNKRLIWDYINGENIDNIDELEDDYEFMMEVIKITHDKKMYHLCSKQIKSNYEFVKFMINEFKKDKEFIVQIANFYLNTINENDTTYHEIVIIMQKLLKYEDLGESEKLDDAIYTYNMAASTLLSKEKLLATMVIQQEEDLMMKKEFGLGFLIIKTGIGYQSEIICDYFATEYLIDIIKDDKNMNLEAFLHKSFTTFQKVKEQGLNHFLIMYISLYDSNLAEYISNHLYLLKDALWVMKRIENNWYNYEQIELEEKKDLFERLANEQIEKYHSIYSYKEYCVHLNRMNLDLPLLLEDYIDEVDKDYLDSKLQLADYRCLKEIVKLAKKIFLTKENNNNLENIFSEKEINPNKTKILNFELRKKCNSANQKK